MLVIISRRCAISASTTARSLDAGTYLTPDLIAEQKMMDGIVEGRGLRCRMLLSKPEDAVEMGYQHVYTVDKHNDLGRCMETLRKVDAGIYERTARLLGVWNM